MSATIPARRNALHDLDLPGEHAGLALDVLLANQGSPDDANTLLDAIAEKCGTNAAYEAAFARWKSALETRGAQLIEVQTASPLAIGLGNAAPLEIGLSLHRTYGLPYLPGSALKGLCRRMARRADLNDEQQKYLLGENDYAGGITFWDGWLLPSDKTPFQRDVVTVHHPDYYNSSGTRSFPTDFDDPTPISFLAVKPGTKFLLALSAPSPEWDSWLGVALQLLIQGLTNEGLGAKTNAGYGRFNVKDGVVQEIVAQTSDELPGELEQLIANIKGPGDFGSAQSQAATLSAAAQKRAAQMMKEKAQAIKWWKSANAEKPTYRWIEERLEDE